MDWKRKLAIKNTGGHGSEKGSKKKKKKEGGNSKDVHIESDKWWVLT